MTSIKIKDKEYKIKFGFNCFCDTDLIERTETIGRMMSGAGAKTDADVSAMGQIKEMFCIVRELLFVGFKKFNPVISEQVVGDLLDDYIDEETDEQRGLLPLFTILMEELMNEGFLAGLMNELTKVQKVPTDHKKTTKK